MIITIHAKEVEVVRGACKVFCKLKGARFWIECQYLGIDVCIFLIGICTCSRMVLMLQIHHPSRIANGTENADAQGACAGRAITCVNNLATFDVETLGGSFCFDRRDPASFKALA